MKLFKQLIALLLLTTGCHKNAEKKAAAKNSKLSKEVVDAAINDTIVMGDINGDHISDTAVVYTPPTLTSLDSKGDVEFTMGCVDNNCYNRVKFSCKLPDLTIPESVWGKVEAIGDLNNDGISEILFGTSWFTTTRSNLLLYSFDGSQWQLIEKVSIRDSEDKTLGSYFVKTKHGNFLKGIEQADGDEKEVLKKVPL